MSSVFAISTVLIALAAAQGAAATPDVDKVGEALNGTCTLSETALAGPAQDAAFALARQGVELIEIARTFPDGRKVTEVVSRSEVGSGSIDLGGETYEFEWTTETRGLALLSEGRALLVFPIEGKPSVAGWMLIEPAGTTTPTKTQGQPNEILDSRLTYGDPKKSVRGVCRQASVAGGTSE